MPQPTYPNFTVTDDIFDADIVNGYVFHAECTSETVADDGYLSMNVQPNSGPNLAAIKMRVAASAGGLTQLFVAENASLELAGTGEALRNLNRITGDTATTTVTVGGSYSNADADIFEEMWGTTGPFAIGGSQDFFFILDPGKNYNINMFNRSGGASAMGLAVLLTEVPK